MRTTWIKPDAVKPPKPGFYRAEIDHSGNEVERVIIMVSAPDGSHLVDEVAYDDVFPWTLYVETERIDRYWPEPIPWPEADPASEPGRRDPLEKVKRAA